MLLSNFARKVYPDEGRTLLYGQLAFEHTAGLVTIALLINILRMTRKENIIYYLFLLFFVVLFCAHTDTPNGIVIGMLLLCGLLYNPIKEKWTLLKERKHLVFMLLFFCNAWGEFVFIG